MNSEREARIQERAYRIWEEEGRPHGREEEHWHRAVHEIDSAQASAGKTTPPTRRASKTAKARVSTAAKASASAKKNESSPASARPAAKPASTAARTAAAAVSRSATRTSGKKPAVASS